jgi:hypothetical protein
MSISSILYMFQRKSAEHDSLRRLCRGQVRPASSSFMTSHPNNTFPAATLIDQRPTQPHYTLLKQFILSTSWQWLPPHLTSPLRTAFTLRPQSRSNSHSRCPPTLIPSSTYSSLSTQPQSSYLSQRLHPRTVRKPHLSAPSSTPCPIATIRHSLSAHQCTPSHTRSTLHNVWQSCWRGRRVVRVTLGTAQASGTVFRVALWKRRWKRSARLSRLSWVRLARLEIERSME